MPEIYDGDCLGETLAKELKGGERILIPRARKGNENLVRLLKEAGGIVDDIPTYETLYESSSLIDIKKEITDKNIDCVVFTSASTVKGFAESTRGADYTGLTAACIGKQTKAAADKLGMDTYMAEKATIEHPDPTGRRNKTQKGKRVRNMDLIQRPRRLRGRRDTEKNGERDKN